MLGNQNHLKKQLFVKKTPTLIEEMINNVINRNETSGEVPFDIISRLQQIEMSALKYNMNEVVHISKTLQGMMKLDGSSAVIPKYMERAFLHLLEEMLLLFQNPSEIQHRLPKIKDEKVLRKVKEYNSNGEARTILIINNDLLFLNKTARLLTEAGFNVLKSNRGIQALNIILESIPDCVIFGLNLIDIETEKFLQNLQDQVNTLFVPIIAIGDKNKKSLMDQIKFNVDDIVVKPFVADELFIKIMRLIDQASRMKNQVYIDELTGIYSRKYIMEKLEYYYCTPNEKDHSHSLVILDLDYFKDVNDKYGHTIGDKVLIEFAEFINSHIRSTDIFARYGGEEFILLLPRTTATVALRKLTHLRKEFVKREINIGDTVIKQTFSGGVVSNRDVTTNHPVEILNLADIALYAAKNSGRNRLLIYEPKMKLKKDKFKILIVDDDRLTRNILLDGLEDDQWSLLQATNGREAIEIAKEHFPNLILLDGLMPEMNGYETLEKIRSDIRFKQTAVIMLTGVHSDENIAKALDAGANDYITKPFSLIELKARINRFLIRH